MVEFRSDGASCGASGDGSARAGLGALTHPQRRVVAPNGASDGSAAGGPLVNGGDSLFTPARRPARSLSQLVDVWDAQRGMWRLAAWRPDGESDELYRRLFPYVTCRRDARVDVGVMLYEGRVSLGGFVHCGRWGCPTCSLLIGLERATDIGLLVAEVIGRGELLAFVTWTIRHNPRQTLAELMTALQGAKNAVSRDRVLKRRRLALSGSQGLRGVFRQDLTTGQAGYHPHEHQLRPFRGCEWSDVEGLLWEEHQVRKRWLRANGWGHLADEPFVIRQVQPSNAGERVSAYMGRSVGFELALSATKRASGENMTMHELLHYAGQTWEVSAVLQVREWWHAIYGKRIIRWSPGLRCDYLGGLTERTDQEAADFVGNAIALGSIERRGYNERIRDYTHPAGAPGQALLIRWGEYGAEQGGPEQARCILRLRLASVFGLDLEAVQLEPPREAVPL